MSFQWKRGWPKYKTSKVNRKSWWDKKKYIVKEIIHLNKKYFMDIENGDIYDKDSPPRSYSNTRRDGWAPIPIQGIVGKSCDGVHIIF